MFNTIWIVIPSHNRRGMTRACLESLQAQSYENFRVIVVDDASLDGTAEMIAADFPDVILIKGSGDLFWAGATNLGVDRALSEAKDQDFILTLNNDLVVNSDYLQTLMKAALENERTLIGSVTVTSEDHDRVMDGGVQVNWLTAKFKNIAKGTRHSQLLNEDKVYQPVDVLSGRGTLIPVEVFKGIGKYNFKKLPHYAADYEFSHRAKAKGYQLLVCNKAVTITNIDATGYDNNLRPISWSEFFSGYSSIRSPYCLYYRWNFATLCCPWYLIIPFFIMDTIRVVLGPLRNQIWNKIVRAK